jgi:hypothetical protein
MNLSVRPALTTAPVVRGLDTDHDLRRGQRCTVLNRPVSLINRGKPVQINRATSVVLWPSLGVAGFTLNCFEGLVFAVLVFDVDNFFIVIILKNV